MLRLAAGAAAAPLVPCIRSVEASAAVPAAPAAGRFFTSSEMAVLDELTELIIPADEHSPGARAARVAAYVDGVLAEYDPEIPHCRIVRERWKSGLQAFDALARDASGSSFLDAPAEQRHAILERLAQNEEAPTTDAERFFVALKRWTARGYYTSAIGLHKELEYKGNSLLMEFEGVDPATLARNDGG